MAGMYGCFKGRNSDSAAMASGPPDVLTNQEPAEGVEECSGKKKSKFQTFKKFFARKKRKEPPAAGAEAGLKASQSTDNVSKTSENNTLTRSEKDKGSGSKISLGSKALSHDSIFVSDSSEATEALGASQDNIHGKVKSLQLQLRQAIRLGSPPSLMCVKRTDDGGTMSEDDGLPCSPPEYTPLHVAMSQNQAQRDSSISLEGIDSDSDQLSCAASSRAVSPLVVPGDFSQPASPFGCLDNSAAKHKLGLRHKACNRRKPARLEMKAEGESVVEETTEERQEATEVVSGDELKPKRGEDEEEEEERRRLLRDEEEREEEESKAEKDVSHDLDSSSPPEPGLSEEGGPDTQPQSSSKPRSRPSSLDSPGATPEPPAGPREYLLDPPGIAYGVELMRVESDLTLSGDEDGVQEIREEEEEEEEESSFLQEVLSSLKTPLASCSLGLESEGVALEIEEEQEEEKEQEDVEEVKDEEDAEVDETVGYQAAPAASFLPDQTEEDEEEEKEEEEATLNTPCCRDVDEEEKVEDEEEAAAEEEEESSPHRQEEEGQKEEAEKEEVEEEEVEEVTPEEEDHMLTRNTLNQAEEEGREEEKADEEEEKSEGEMEAIELEKEVEKEEEGREKREEEDEEAKERVEEAEEAMEEEEAEEMFPDAADEDVAMATREEDEGVDVVVGDDGETEPVHESQAESEQEREGGDEKVEEGQHTGQRSEEEEEEEEANRPDEDQSEPDEVIETSHEAAEAVASKPPSLSLPESHDETQSQHSGPSTPSKTSILHINLLSPSSEKTAASFFQQSPTEEEAPRHAEAAADKHAEEEGEPADSVEVPEEEKQLEPEGEAPPPLSVEGEAPPPVEGEVTQPSGGSDHCKDQFTDKEEGSPSPSSSSLSALTTPGGEEVEEEKEEAKEDPATPAKVELLLSPGRVRNAGSGSPSSTNVEERSGGVEGNNPFGVRLRKTSALHRFSSEEENAEAPAEPPAQPTSCRVDSPQPIITRPSVSQPISSKPSLPKKPDVPGDAGGKNKRMSDPAPLRGVSGGSESPSWISVAKQKQKIYKENSLEEISVRKEEQERKSSLPMFVSSAGRESTGKVSPLEVSRPSASIEKETRRSLSPPTPVPPQPPKSQSLPCPIPPKPQLPPATAKHPPQPNSPQRSLSPPTPIPQKSPSCTSPPSPSKTATSSSKLTSPPFSSRTGPDKSGSRAPGLSSQTLTSQRGLPPAALPQDEPPWMALAKKKAKAWSEMPQIVQ